VPPSPTVPVALGPLESLELVGGVVLVDWSVVVPDWSVVVVD
jgi:hypothetical protein